MNKRQYLKENIQFYNDYIYLSKFSVEMLWNVFNECFTIEDPYTYDPQGSHTPENQDLELVKIR